MFILLLIVQLPPPAVAPIALILLISWTLFGVNITFSSMSGGGGGSGIPWKMVVEVVFFCRGIPPPPPSSSNDRAATLARLVA